MSHSHTHAPGEVHDHSHGPAQPQQQQPQQLQQPPPPDPAALALIDADFKPVDLALGEPANAVALCGSHKQETCAVCDVDFASMNKLSRLLVNNPTLLAPPPPNVISQNLSKIVTTTKDEGNAMFKAGKHPQAIERYTLAANYATQRPPWEANQFLREELTTVISNRSASFLESGNFLAALADADTVVALRRNWSKGHFRKSKALLGLGQVAAATEAIRLGLQFEPANAELLGFLADLEKVDKTLQQTKEALRAPVAV